MARRQLDGMNTSGSVLGCQFVPSSLVQFTDLQSRCLLVTNVPHDISTTATLHRIFSVVSAPAFCLVVNTAVSMDVDEILKKIAVIKTNLVS